jgi:DNA-binding Lrp family transcriptional regulator
LRSHQSKNQIKKSKDRSRGKELEDNNKELQYEENERVYDIKESENNGRSSKYNVPISKLSYSDKEILKILLSPENGLKRSTLLLARKLGIPQTTIRRRRKRLEENFLSSSYILNIEKFGWRRVDLLISTRRGKTDSVANKLLENKEVVYVGKSIGEHAIDLRVEIIIRDNAELLDILEKVKAMDGVNDVIWSEIVQVIGAKRSIPAHIIDML